MSDMDALTDAQVILLAAHYISEVDVESIRTLAAKRRDILTNDVIYRLLLTLYPSDHAARAALATLLRDVQSDFSQVDPLNHDVDTSFISKTSSTLASKQIHDLGFSRAYGQIDGSTNSLSTFLTAWAHRVEYEEGSLEFLTPLLEGFCKENTTLSRWTQRYFVPLYRLQYFFYPEAAGELSLQTLETLRGGSGIETLLSFAQKSSMHADLARDLEQVVRPWIEPTIHLKGDDEGKEATASWNDVFEWLLFTSQKDFMFVGQALLIWDGPQTSESNHHVPGIQKAYAQTIIAIVYASQSTTDDSLRLSRQLLQLASSISKVQIVQLEAKFPDITRSVSPLMRASPAELLLNTLLVRENPLTQPTEASLAFLHGVVQSAEILSTYKLLMKISDIAQICLFGSEERQKLELNRMLQQIPKMTSFKPDWPLLRQQTHWLRTWQNLADDQLLKSAGVSFLGRLPKELVDIEILKSMLAASYFAEVKQIYIIDQSTPLPLSEIEEQVVAAIFVSYDNSSNGNRTRGGMKRASEILSIFKSSFQASERLQPIECLLKATHSLSFYHLTLEHGVPFRPVNVRASRNPLSLVEKVLEQDHKAYTKIDDLLEIGRNLVLSRIGVASTEPQSLEPVQLQLDEANQRVTYLAITAALSNHDFNTAYSYITTRLSTSPTDVMDDRSSDDVTWRAVYAAGRYKPPNSPKSLHDRIAELSKRMDLLSLALALVPNDESLSEILGQWRRCEEEMDSLKSQALQEERALDNSGVDETVPGGFGYDEDEQDAAETRRALAKRNLANSTASYEEEAPMGLFDVARGAASALRRSAFPLSAGRAEGMKVRNDSLGETNTNSRPTSPEDEHSGRVRKRDMVSNMVTSGLVSGMGWVLGAQPAGHGINEPD